MLSPGEPAGRLRADGEQAPVGMAADMDESAEGVSPGNSASSSVAASSISITLLLIACSSSETGLSRTFWKPVGRMRAAVRAAEAK